jgi:hypothetical protein
VASLEGGVTTLAQLFAVADHRLYAAKAGGRDRVVGDQGQEAETAFPEPTGQRSA